MDLLAKLSMVAFLTESLVEWFLGTWLEGPMLKYAAAAVAVVLSVGFGLDFFKEVGLLSDIPYLGSVLTGLVVSRGSEYLHTLFNALSFKK